VTKKTAIIGAGIAGLSCARALRRAGISVEVFEQERTIGGRIATTRLGSEMFDHGAQYVCARSPAFRDYLRETSERGYAGLWTPRTRPNGSPGDEAHPWLVGMPGMSSLVRPLAEHVRVTTGRRVHALERGPRGWHLWFDDETSAGPFEAVAAAVPPAQAHALFGRIEELIAPLSRARLAPCWALMVRIEQRILPDQDVFSGLSETIRWIARNNTKPGRNSDGEDLVIQAAPGWSRTAEDCDPEAVAEELWSEVSHALGLPPVRPSHMTAHLWRYGLVEQAVGEACLYSREHKAGIAGDWCSGHLAEHAFESGAALGRAIRDSLT
jgi:renalase